MKLKLFIIKMDGTVAIVFLILPFFYSVYFCYYFVGIVEFDINWNLYLPVF